MTPVDERRLAIVFPCEKKRYETHDDAKAARERLASDPVLPLPPVRGISSDLEAVQTKGV